MRSIFVWISDLVVHRPYQIMIVLAVCIIISLFGMSMVTMHTGTDTYIDFDSTRGNIVNHYQDTFQQNNLVLLIESDDSTSPVLLQYIDTIEEPLGRLQYVSSTSSIVDLIKSVNNQNVPLTQAEVSAATGKIPSGILSKYVPSGMLTMVLVTLDPGLSDDKKETAMANIKKFIASTDIPPGVSVKLTGDAVFSVEMKEEMGSSAITLIMIALVLMVIVMGILFSYVSHRFLPVFIVAVSLLFTFGVMGLSHTQISLAVIAAFPVLIGLGIDYSIQFHSRLEEEARKDPLPVAIRTTITHTGPAVLYAMLATAMGFLAMFISPVPMVRGFGMVSILGVMISYVTALIGVPICAILLKYQAKGEGKSALSEHVDAGLSRIAVVIANNALPVLLIAGLVAFIGIQYDSTIPVDTNERSFVPGDMPAKLTLDKVNRYYGSTDPVPILIYGSNILSLDTLKWVQEFQKHELKDRYQLTGSTSIVDYITTYNGGKMPETQGELELVLAKIPENIQHQYLNGRNEGIIQFTTIKLEVSAKESLKNQINGDLKLVQPPPGVHAQVTGSFDLFTALIHDLVESKENMTYLGFVLVALFLLLVYRNVNAVTPIVPIICIVGWNAVAMILAGVDYSPMTACLGSMTIGVAAEYTILVMERYIEEREKTENVLEALQNSVRKIGSAIMISGFATFFGFSALIASTFPIISNFGLTTIIAVLFSLIGAVIVMPAILMIMHTLIVDIGIFSHAVHQKKDLGNPK